MNLLPLDVGRPVSHVSNKFIDTDLIAIADGVLKTLIPAEKEVLTSNGLWRMLRCVPYRTSNDVIDGVVFTFSDITRLKRSEEALIESKDYAENILHTTREALLVLDPELRVVSANRAFYEAFQVTPQETENRLIYELGNRQWDVPKLRELLEDILPTNSVVHDFEVTHDFPAIGPRIMSLNASGIYNQERKQMRLILLAMEDVTERRQIEVQRSQFSHELEKKVFERTEELEQANRVLLQDMEERAKLEGQLRQVQKMESMGTLAAGIAHDLNNILNIVQGYTSVLGRTHKSDEIGESVAVITETTKRGAALVQQLLTVARKTETKLEPVNANTLIERLGSLLIATFPRTIEVSLDLARELPPIMADPNQITQVLLNLCVNARDAMPNGGSIALETTTLAVDQEQPQNGYASHGLDSDPRDGLGAQRVRLVVFAQRGLAWRGRAVRRVLSKLHRHRILQDAGPSEHRLFELIEREFLEILNLDLAVDGVHHRVGANEVLSAGAEERFRGRDVAFVQPVEVVIQIIGGPGKVAVVFQKTISQWTFKFELPWLHAFPLPNSRFAAEEVSGKARVTAFADRGGDFLFRELAATPSAEEAGR